jgi:hypothetical protein
MIAGMENLAIVGAGGDQRRDTRLAGQRLQDLDLATEVAAHAGRTRGQQLDEQLPPGAVLPRREDQRERPPPHRRLGPQAVWRQPPLEGAERHQPNNRSATGNRSVLPAGVSARVCPRHSCMILSGAKACSMVASATRTERGPLRAKVAMELRTISDGLEGEQDHVDRTIQPLDRITRDAVDGFFLARAMSTLSRKLHTGRLHLVFPVASRRLFRWLHRQFAGYSPHRPITLSRIAAGILSISGTLNTPEATRTISPSQIRSQLQKQKLTVRRATRAVPSSHWPSLAPRTNSVLSDTVGCGQRMPWRGPSPAHHHVGHGDQQAAMRPAHRVAVARLERQADAQLLALGLVPERADQR